MSKLYKLKKGFDIKLAGKAERHLNGEILSAFYGIKPPDFPGLTVSLCVKPGDNVKIGTSLFFDKVRPEIRFTSPVSGKVIAVNRGEQRKILEVVIERDGDEYEYFGKAEVSKLTREEIIRDIMKAGLWPAIRQRPYHIIAWPERKPKSIFISGFDTAPLAPDMNFVMDNTASSYFQTGLDVLTKLTDGKVNLILNSDTEPSPVLKNAKNVVISYFKGPHPAGNIGVHINHIDPVNKGEVIWYVNLQDIVTLGRLFEEGIYKNERIIALTGSEVQSPGYYKVRNGACIKDIVAGNIKEGIVRYISGNVLTGTNVGINGFLGFYDSMISVIPEGNYYELFGWALPGINKYSFSRAFLSSIFKKKEYRLDTNLHGSHRPFVMTGLYEKVLPMDIYPMQLLKAILAEDIEMMENLGIYEVAEEDFALCEFICPSKMEIQTIIRQGINMMIKEMS
ncbi:MAG TPA: Na(+)-translocating NADH-quinone reductase subunit A [Bacteroidales bacterium]|nr:Na(+)-translocating NADH-quinone reductase subunit A [Bacteroidales bacterium]HCI56240.1 NADH:ubiquinone reductase (Na(+)-transporting) subunit A [Bacteroidales bacterium]HOU95883.1 Na(+)-translocating NADH-quinone reductase subunit A [Bacteroidales bacterium]HQG35888.1 Na(+)-translocating NADH-quinone reductase subunit A [Bacteroidales bacterium]HQG52398.1 Na(+)-translocating NADH-quinone reductase subunit A [Bacteroidales bacterium]